MILIIPATVLDYVRCDSGVPGKMYLLCDFSLDSNFTPLVILTSLRMVHHD